MIICFNISRDTKEKMDLLMQAGQYKDNSEIVAVAVANQYLLHASADEAPPTAHRSPGAQITATDEVSPVTRPETPKAPRVEVPTTKISQATIPELFRLNPSEYKTLSLASLPSDAFVIGMEVPVDRWIFGQHNKLLPVKANVRALANILCEANKRSDSSVDRISNEIASAASQLGDFLRNMDAQSERSRDETLAVAFPSSDRDNSDRSRLRYASQFVGAVTREGRMSGLLVDLKLVNYDRHKPGRVRLTEPGARFAELRNPILDGAQTGESDRFSLEERTFLIEHIRGSVPVENFAYKATLAAIHSGANTPEQLDAALARYLPDRPDKPFTPAFLTTQRAGVISRMSDLGLVERIRQGPNVMYAVTLMGQKLLEGTV